MPVKGSSSKARNRDSRCSRTGLRILMQWAFDLRFKTVQAVTPTKEQVQQLLSFNDEPTEGVGDEEDEPLELLKEYAEGLERRLSGIVEVEDMIDDGSSDEEIDSDDEED